jgi:hypothetical protein
LFLSFFPIWKRLPKMDIDDIVAQGELFKQGHRRQSWNKRKFVLAGPFLTYFDQQDVKKGEIDITGCILERKTPEECQMPPAKHAFAITGPQRSLLVSASNEDNRILWMGLIQKQIEEFKQEYRKYVHRSEIIIASGKVSKIGMISWMSSEAHIIITNFPRVLIVEGGYIKDTITFTKETPFKFQSVDKLKFKLIDPRKSREYKFTVESQDILSYWEVACTQSITNMPPYKRKDKSFAIGRDRVSIVNDDISRSIETIRKELSEEQVKIEEVFEQHELEQQEQEQAVASKRVNGRVRFAEENTTVEAAAEDETEEAEYEEGDEEEFYDDEEEEYEEDEYFIDEDAVAEEEEDPYDLLTVAEAMAESSASLKELLVSVSQRASDLDAHAKACIQNSNCEEDVLQAVEVVLTKNTLKGLADSTAQLTAALDKLTEVANVNDAQVLLTEDDISSIVVQSRELIRQYVPKDAEGNTVRIADDKDDHAEALKRHWVQLRTVVEAMQVEVTSMVEMVKIAHPELTSPKKTKASAAASIFGSVSFGDDDSLASKPQASPVNGLPPAPPFTDSTVSFAEPESEAVAATKPGEGRVKLATRRYTAMANKIADSAAAARNKQTRPSHIHVSLMRGHEEFNGSLVFEKARGIAKCSVGGIMLDLTGSKFSPEDPHKRPQGWARIRLYKVVRILSGISCAEFTSVSDFRCKLWKKRTELPDSPKKLLLRGERREKPKWKRRC